MAARAMRVRQEYEVACAREDLAPRAVKRLYLALSAYKPVASMHGDDGWEWSWAFGLLKKASQHRRCAASQIAISRSELHPFPSSR